MSTPATPDALEMPTFGQNSGSNNNGSQATIYYKPISDPSLLPRKRSQVSGACSNLVNSIVGAGIIGIPFALQQSGLVSGVILLLLVGYFTDKSLRMMVDLATCSPQLRGRGVWTYDDLMLLPFGPKGRVFVLCSMFITAYGAMVAYLLIIKDTLPVVWGLVEDGDASVGGFVERELVMLGTSLAVVVPLSMQRDFSSLSFTSTISVVADILLVIFVAVYAPIGESLENAGGLGNVIQNSIIDKGFFIGFGVLTVAMCCQHSAFIVASSLDNPTPKRWSVVTAVSLSASTLLCLVLGVAGYLGFLDETNGDVLNNFDADSTSANVARGLLAVTMFFTYPMEAFVARHVLVQLIWKGDLDGYVFETTVDPVTGEERSSQYKAKICHCLSRRHQVTLLIYLMTLAPALIVDDLGPVLSITGAIGGCCLAYIGPGLAYLGVHGQDFLEKLARSIAAKNPGDGVTTTGEADLPIDGDANAKLSQQTSLFCPHKLFAEKTHHGYKKPWWWYPLCIPLWIPIALEGSKGMNERLTALDEEFQHPVSPGAGISTADDPITESANPNGDSDSSPSPSYPATSATSAPIVDASLTNYGFAIFFIVFGTIALVAGVASNMYAQINGHFAVAA